MMARRVFYSFHYQPDCWRASTVRNIGVIESNQPATDNDWESITRAGDAAIQQWIASQIKGRTCTIVLVGASTASRKWINYEIVKSWDTGMGVVGIRVHGIKDASGNVSAAGANPFDFITHGGTGQRLSNIVKCYDPDGASSQERYNWIKTYLAAAVEEAISIRSKN